MADKSRSTKFLNAAILAAKKFACLNDNVIFDHTSGSISEVQDQKNGNRECRQKLKRKRHNLTKQEELLRFFKKSKFDATLDKDLPFIQKVLRDGMRRAKLPRNPAVVPDNFSVSESEAGEYYVELNIKHIYSNGSCIDGDCDFINDFERTNHPDMFQQAIDVFSQQIQKWATLERKALSKFPSEKVLKIRDNKVRGMIPHKSELYSVRVPPGVTKICSGAFRRCNWLEKVVLPESIESIGQGSFRWCISLESVAIPSGTTTIGGGAFAGNLSLRSIVVPASVTTLGCQLFELCMSLTHVSLPATLESIPDEAFRYCVNLTHLDLPDSVTHIGTHSFAHCVSLLKLRLPQNLKTVSDYAFQACAKVSECKLPYPKDEKVQFGKDVFFECYNLKTVLQLPAAPWVFVVWALGKSRNRNNWQITTIAYLRNVLRLIGRFTVEKHNVAVDPNVLSSPCNVPRRRVRTPLVPIIISWSSLFCATMFYTDKLTTQCLLACHNRNCTLICNKKKQKV